MVQAEDWLSCKVKKAIAADATLTDFFGLAYFKYCYARKYSGAVKDTGSRLFRNQFPGFGKSKGANLAGNLFTHGQLDYAYSHGRGPYQSENKKKHRLPASRRLGVLSNIAF
ncbi:hypothetical protein AAE02nite_39550 [Adhaeribacter aerolatus]|uniref:Uncharacterized protein n=1 Tax=Adhaeribacter aerolatus TaxID=670289 RepID=A0A512B2W3_9BACT|nr:hypothetical protein [Adhaeribacter aerolatus]GEO06291.1 hypothetical protein AAE02nite_39550 [Adhaeribacter aerolatus]